MDIIDIAVRFSQSGYYVFPLYKDHKGNTHQPFGWAGNKVKDNKPTIPATKDPQEIINWSEEVKEKYNGELCGYGVVGKGIIIVDIDMKNDKNGLESYQQIVKKYHIPKPLMMTKTKSGGYHIYFKKSDKYKDTRVKSTSGVKILNDKFEGVDIRGDSGYVVGPSDFVKSLDDVQEGKYGMVRFCEIQDLPIFPDKILSCWNQGTVDDLQNMAFVESKNMEIKDQVRRGILPDVIPKGSRNDTFFAFVSALKYQGASADVAKKMCHELALRCEEPDTLSDSVDIDDMISRAYTITEATAKGVAFDLIKKGLYQVVGYKAIPYYTILEDNPYITYRGLYNETMMSRLLISYSSPVMVNGKSKMINPMDIIPKLISDISRVDMIGFKPGAGSTFNKGSRKFLNSYLPPTINKDIKVHDISIWTEFTTLVSRLFGPPDSFEYQLGLDFISWMIQRPQNKPNISPFIISMNRGVGKSLLFNILTHIMGSSKTGDPQAKWVKIDEITGRFFNPTNCLINLIDEVQFAIHSGTRKESTAFWRQLKSLITSETISVEIKGGETFQMPNTAAIILAGNSGQYFPVEEFDRRLWVIDADAPLLEVGTVDRLFDLIQNEHQKPDYYERDIQILRYHLKNHKIKNNLAIMKAPMTAIKEELYEAGLTDIEAWFVTHFKDPGNVFANTPIVSKSAMTYLFETFSGLSNERDLQTFFRSLKRKSFIRPIKLKSNKMLSRQFTVPEIKSDGSMDKKNMVRQILYTTRDHGSFDDKETSVVMELWNQNCATVQRYKTQIKTITSEELLYCKGA